MRVRAACAYPRREKWGADGVLLSENCRCLRSSIGRLTQSDLTKGDRTRVMVCITMDAHGRDVVQKMAREGVAMVRNVTF